MRRCCRVESATPPVVKYECKTDAKVRRNRGHQAEDTSNFARIKRFLAFDLRSVVDAKFALRILLDEEREALAEYHARRRTDPTVIALVRKERPRRPD
jgi:hypothetical protein